jgi:hypothetical protein
MDRNMLMIIAAVVIVVLGIAWFYRAQIAAPPASTPTAATQPKQ